MRETAVVRWPRTRSWDQGPPPGPMSPVCRAWLFVGSGRQWVRVVSPRSFLGQKKLLRLVKSNDTGAGESRATFWQVLPLEASFISSGTLWFKEKHNVSQYQLHIFYMRNSGKPHWQWNCKVYSFCTLIKFWLWKKRLLTGEVTSGSANVFGFFSTGCRESFANTSIPKLPYSSRI